jgi:hypothetical protein
MNEITEALTDEQLRHIADSKDTGTCRARISAALAAAEAQPVADRRAYERGEVSGQEMRSLYASPPVASTADGIIADLVRLADMGFDDSLKEPEENGNFAAYERAKRYLAARPTPSVDTEARRMALEADKK